MKMVRDERGGDRARRDGNVMIFVLVGLVAIIGFTSLAIDVGLAYNSRTQAQAAADASALAAANTMIAGASVTLANGTAAAVSVAGQNPAYPNPSLVLAPADVTYGNWDLDTRTFDTSVDLTDPLQVTAVQTIVRLDDVINPSVPAVMSRVLGIDRFTVDAEAIAYLGFAGSVQPGTVELPIAIPCCVLKGSQCTGDCNDAATCGDYCAEGAPVPNPCPLTYDESTVITCIEFESTPEQTGCWTQFDGDHPSINTADLNGIASTDYDGGLNYYDPIFLDNGDKTPVIATIADRFYGEGEFVDAAEGIDRYGDDGIIDSWVTGLPVVNCQNEDICATGDPAHVLGYVCIEIMEVNVVPQKIIRARFLCPELHPEQYQECLAGLGTTGTGGQDFGIRADIPVLVR